MSGLHDDTSHLVVVEGAIHGAGAPTLAMHPFLEIGPTVDRACEERDMGVVKKS